MECNVTVKDCKQYNEHTGVAEFERMRSMKLTQLFFTDISKVSSKESRLIQTLHKPMRKNIPKMVKYINDNGGWTIAGWHRRGMIPSEKESEQFLNSFTIGHCTHLQPTSADLTAKECTDLKLDLKDVECDPTPP